MLPVRALMARTRVSRLTRPPSSTGMVPARALSLKFRTLRLERLPSSGISPPPVSPFETSRSCVTEEPPASLAHSTPVQSPELHTGSDDIQLERLELLLPFTA